MLRFVFVSALLFCVTAQDYGHGAEVGYGGHEALDVGYGGHALPVQGYGGHGEGHGYAHAVHVPLKPIYAKASIPVTVKVGESHHSYPVPEHKFTYNEYRTPGNVYAIPAVKTYTLTRPGYTTYLQSHVTKAHVSTHQVAGPTIYKPIIAPVVQKAIVPVHKEEHGHSLGHGSHYY